MTQYHVQTNRLHLRQSPGMHGPILSELQKNQLVNVVGEPVVIDDLRWVQIDHPEKGWVDYEYLTTQNSMYALVQLRVHPLPGIDKPVIGQILTGQRVILLGGTITDDHYTWVQITEGWVAQKSKTADYLTDVPIIQPKRSKIGLHAHMGTDVNALIEAAIKLNRAKKPLGPVVVINDTGLANSLKELGDVYAVIRRQDSSQDINPDVPESIGQDQAVQLGKDYVTSRWNFIYETADPLIPCQFQNEPGYHHMDAYVNIGIMQACEARGRKAAWGCYAVGNPGGDDWENKWRTLEPAMRYAMANNHPLLLHEYGTQNPPDAAASDPRSLDFYSLRHRKVYALMPVDARPKLIIGETGTFNARYINLDFLINDMREYGKLLDQDEYVIGFSYWTLGGQDCGWLASSLNNVLPHIVDFLMNL